jgi:hypothetical protein
LLTANGDYCEPPRYALFDSPCGQTAGDGIRLIRYTAFPWKSRSFGRTLRFYNLPMSKADNVLAGSDALEHFADFRQFGHGWRLLGWD